MTITQKFEVPSSQAEQIKAKIRRYYQAATDDYLRYYQSHWHHHMHYGFERNLPKRGNPTENLIRYMSDIAGLQAGQRLLDAGCGVGGSAIWLSKNLSLQCVGITLMQSQANLAKGFAGKAQIQVKACRFLVNDFTMPCFRKKSFDAIWAIESFDHAPEKKEWIHEMAELLKPGAKLIIADGFRSGKKFSTSEERQYKGFLEGWAVPHLCSAAELRQYTEAAGLKVLHAENISDDIAPHAQAISRFGLIFVPWRWFLNRLGLCSQEKLGNAKATWLQYRAFKANLWTYQFFVFQKP